MTKLNPSQRALVLYQHLQGAAWINAEQLAVDRLSAPDGIDYFKEWITQHYLDVEVTQVGRSLSDLFRKLKRRPAQSFRDYVAEYNRLSARVAECGCRLPDIASAWLFVDRANLDESTEVSLLASVGNRYHLQQLQQAAIILDRSMRKPWERAGRANTVHMTEEIEDEEGDEEPVLQDELGDHDNGDLYVSYMTAKARYKDAAKARGVDVEAVRRTAEQKVALAKSKSHCAACGQKGHWHRDAVCPKNKAAQNAQTPKSHSVHVTNEVFELTTAPGGPLLAITDTACSRCVVGATWLQRYMDDVKAQSQGSSSQAYPHEFLNEKESFRFGASRVYESSYAAVIITKVGDAWLAIKAAVIHGDIPLLLSRPLLASLGMVFDVEHNVASFRKINVNDLRLTSTPSGHPALTIRCEGCSSVDHRAVPKAWGNRELEILKTRGAYMSFVVGHGGAVVQGSNHEDVDGGEREYAVSRPVLFYAKKIPPAIHEALVADSLNMNIFLGWWNSTAISNDFWIETEHKLVRIHVTPRKSFFCATRWQTSKTIHRDRLLDALGDVRESWGIACTTQRELSTTIDRWRECETGGYSVLWIGRSVFNRAVRCPRDPEPRYEHPARAMEDEQGGTPARVHEVGDSLPREVDGTRTTPPPVRALRDRADLPQAPDLNVTTRASRGSRESGDWLRTEGNSREHHAQDPRLLGSRPDHHDGRATQGGPLRGDPGELWGMGIGGGTQEWGEHAPGPQAVCHLAAGEKRAEGDQLRRGLLLRRPGSLSGCSTPANADIQHGIELNDMVGGTRDHEEQGDGATTCHGQTWSATPCGGGDREQGPHAPGCATGGGGRDYGAGDPSSTTTGSSWNCPEPGTALKNVDYTHHEDNELDNNNDHDYNGNLNCGENGHFVEDRPEDNVEARRSVSNRQHNDDPAQGGYENHKDSTNNGEYEKDIVQGDHTDGTNNGEYEEDIVQGDHKDDANNSEYEEDIVQGNHGGMVGSQDDCDGRGGPTISDEESSQSETEEIAHAMVVESYLTGRAKEKGQECDRRAKEALAHDDFTYETLEEIMELIPLSARAKKRQMHGAAEPRARHVFGYYAYGNFGGICRRTFEYPNLVCYLNKFMEQQVDKDLGEAGRWNAISVLENVPASIHTDNNNYPNTYNYAVSTGAYVGGELWVQCPGGGMWKCGKGGSTIEGKHVCNYQQAIAIDPKLQHGVEEWGGKRWVLVAYTTRNVMNSNPCEKRALTKLGFPLPSKVKPGTRPTTTTREMPRRSTRKGLWKRAAELSVMFATLSNVYSNCAGETYQLKAQVPKVSMVEIGDVSATCYAADILGEHANLAEPILWEDYEWWKGTSATVDTEQLWIHTGDIYYDKHKDELEHIANEHVKKGKTVVFEDNFIDNDARWGEIGCKWKEGGHDVDEDYTSDGHRILRVHQHEKVQDVYIGETVDGSEEGGAEKVGAAGITFDKNVPAQVATALRRAHQNLGHPSTADFVRHLRVAGARPEVLRAAKGLKCETCTRTQAPAISKPAAIGNILQFNQVVGADLLYVHDVNGRKHEMLSIVDFSSSYHIVIPVARKDTPTLEQAFCQHWVNVFGAPGTIAIDLENGLQKALARVADWTGMAIRSCAGQAHWQAGFTERQGGAWKAIFNRVSEDKNVTQADIHLAVAAVSHAKNTLRKVSGFSPAQHVFGQAPTLAEDLLDGPLAHVPDGEVVVDDKHAREVAMRTAARAAFHFVQTDDRVRRALQGRARVQAREPNVGDRVFFYRKAKNSKRGWWRGPATVIGKEANNIWVSRAGRCLLCAPEHVRLATNQELGHMFALRASKDDLDKLLNADYDDKATYAEDAEEYEDENQGQELDMEEVVMENEDMEVDGRGVRRPNEIPAQTVTKRFRKKGPAAMEEAKEVMVLKRAKTERSRAKQLEKELPWHQIPDDKREEFRAAEDKQWREHMEHDALEVLDVKRSREIEDTVPRGRILSSRWAYRDKNLAQRRANPGVAWRPKARLVIGGHEDPDLAGGRVISDSPTVSRATLILLLQICCSRTWQAAAGDVAAAFLNGVYIQRTLFMRQPRGGVRGLDPRQLLCVKKGIFGLTESPRLWYDRLTAVMLGHTFSLDGKDYRMNQCPLDPCVYMLQSHEGAEPIAYVAVHVDDLLVIASPDTNKGVREQLSKLFPVDDWEIDNFDYIGSHVATRNGEIMINQEAFVDGRLFTLDIDPKASNDDEASEEQLIDNRSLVGALSWLAGQSRPDLQCGVALAQQRQKAPTVGDLRFTNALAKKAAEHRSEGVRLRPIPLDKGIFYAFHDAGWANADEQDADEDFKLTPEEEKQRTMTEGPPGPGKAKRNSSRVASQLGHVIMFGNLDEAHKDQTKASLLEWRSQTCQRVCRSTFGAETMACAEGLESGQFLRALLATLLTGKLVRLQDAREWWPIICLTDCRSLHDHLHRAGIPRVPADRRLAVDLAAIRQEFRRKTERAAIQWLPTTCQVADPLTKPMKCRDWWQAQANGIRLPFDVLSKIVREN